MTTSGTYAYNPSLGEITLYAFNLCGVRSTALTQEYMESARMASNLLLGRWSSEGVNLWKVELVTTPLIEGVTTYNYDPSVIVMLDAYISTDNGDGTFTDRLILPVSRSEYASYPNKSQQGFPTVFWADRLLNPTVTLWPVPDGNQTFLKYYCVRQVEDANFTNGQTLDLPLYFLEAFAYGLAQRLSLIWAPEKSAMLKPLADEAYLIATQQNVETAAQYISPMISGYFRT
jgi:hypothetical protein